MHAVDPATIAICNYPDLLARMPLAQAALAIWRLVFDEQRLDRLWQQFRGRCYHKVISFPTIAHLVSDALLLHNGSGRRSFEKNIESGQLDASVAAAFGKLGRLPLQVSQGLLREGTRSLGAILPQPSPLPAPGSLSALAVILIDGKAIKRVAKRLKPLRGVGGGLLGGKAVVALDHRSGLALAMQTHPDGDASEKPLTAGLLSQVYEVAAEGCLFVADRGFCDLVRLANFTARGGDHFLVRYQSNTKFTADPGRPEETGTDARGRPYVESWGWLGGEKSPGRRYVRRIALRRCGEEDLILVTDLLDGQAYPAVELLELYQQRWGIERVFHKVTDVFGLSGLIGSTPKACIFQLGFCLMLYNIVQVLTGYVARAKGCAAAEVSQEKLFDDVRDQLIAWNVAFTPGQTVEHFRGCPTAEGLREWLEEELSGVWSETWWKSKPQPDRQPSGRVGKRGHASVFRILQASAKADARAGAEPPATHRRC